MSETYGHHFSVRNIPFGIASSPDHPRPQAVTRLVDSVIFLNDCKQAGLFDSVETLPNDAFTQETLNAFAALPTSTRREVRAVLSTVFQESQGNLKESKLPLGAYEDIDKVSLHMPVTVCDFVDFSCSLEHVKNAGRIIINDERPPPAFFNLPIGYQGRASSVVVSGTDIQRPMGQFRDKTASSPADGGPKPVVYGPSAACDYEMEFAAIIGKPLPMNASLNATEADEHVFGYVLMNDWSARDIQGFEMMPLGPLIGKNFGTTISPWVVTPEALEPFKTSSHQKTTNTTLPPYLRDPESQTYNIGMQVEILAAEQSTVVGRSRLQSLYWSPRQMIAHVASGGAALRTGDIMATGTVSGPGDGALGCLLEVTEGGVRPFRLKDGSERRFLQDGDVVRITAVAGEDDSGVGFGQAVGKLVPSCSRKASQVTR